MAMFRNRKFPQVAIYGKAAAAAPPSTTTWNPADKNSNITVSGGDLTDTSSVFAFNSIRAIASHSSGKYYFEILPTAPNSNDTVGIANSSESLNNPIGNTLNSIGWLPYNGTVNINGASVATVAGTFGGTGPTVTYGIAVDFGNQTIWFKVGSGNWNNSGTADPSTNTGGISFATLNAGPFFPAQTLVGSPSTYTANFGGSAYAFTPPAGFGNW